MLRGLYDWTLSLAARKSAEWWLAFIAFVESSVFLVPADVLYLPMALSRPDRAYRYALVATAASVLGGIAGWFIGHYAYEAVARPVLEFYGKYDEFEALRTSSGSGFIILMLITSVRPTAADQGGTICPASSASTCCSSSAGDPWRAARASCCWPGCCAATASRSATSSKSASASSQALRRPC